MKNYSKTLDTYDYVTTKEINGIDQIINAIIFSSFRPFHQHRKWEYGICLNALRESGAKTVLDVGGTGSMFAACATFHGMDVTVLDPDAEGAYFIENQNRVFKRDAIRFINEDFFQFKTDQKYDAVVCISTLEHVPNDFAFFKRLLGLVKDDGLVFLTMDFHPNGMVHVDGHLRTYNQERIETLINIAKQEGFEIFGESPDYTWRAPDVNGYTFASLALRKKGHNSGDFFKV